MREDILELKARIGESIKIIDEIIEKLKNVGEANNYEKAIISGYYIHNLYCAFEDVFKNISIVFGNKIEDDSLFHKELLFRMKIDVEEIRPKIISTQTYEILEILRRFRHLFRHAYSFHLDGKKIEEIKKLIPFLSSKYKKDFKKFLDFLSKIKFV